MKLLKKMRYIFSILLVVFLLFSGTPVVHTPGAHGFIISSLGLQLEGLKLLMPHIFKPQWKIGYRYGANCKPSERQHSKNLEKAITASLQLWLQPLKELKPTRPIVDKFVYELQADFDPHKPENLDDLRAVDLQVTFECNQGVSGAPIGRIYPPAVIMRAGTEVSPWLSYVLAHELGHTFGLADTYARQGYMRNRGGLPWTTGKQPWSLMSGPSYGETPQAIGEDDKRGIIWLYKYFHEDLATDDCFFADYMFVEEPRGCRPRHLLIFEIKHNRHPEPALQLLKDDPAIDINAQDASGMTALHYAVLHEKVEVVKALLARKEIDALIINKQRETPYDLALATGNADIIAMLPAPPRRKEDFNADGVVNILDLVAVAAKFGQKDTGNADVNGDGTVDIRDLVLVAGAFGTTAAAPPLPAEARLTAATVAGQFETAQRLTPHADYVRGLRQSLHAESHLTAATVAGWLTAAQKLTPHADYVRGLRQLQHLHAYLTPSKTELLANFPNPFNPETWVPYRLDKAAQVNIHIYNAQGHLVRTLALGSQPAGVYQDKSRAAYWNGRNNQGEPVASGVYFYTLTAGEFTATRKMLIRK